MAISSRKIKAFDLSRVIQSEKSFQCSSENYFASYLVCNEFGYDRVIRQIDAVKVTITDLIKVAFLVGESNILSLLPELAKHVDVVVCNDINPKLMQYTQFLINCLTHANSRAEFKKEYFTKKENQSLFSDEEKLQEYWDLLNNVPVESCKDKHILYSEERFIQCKSALENLIFVWTGINVFNDELCCSFQETLRQQGAVICVINLTNLQHYDKGPYLTTTVPILLKNSTNLILPRFCRHTYATFLH